MSRRDKIKKEAIKTIEIEIQALQQLRTSIGEEFVDVVSILINSAGRLVITGLGKSALVAKKIVATLNSTGTPSLFMHAADAIHGDLGMIRKDDILMCISKSGNTAELKILIPLVKAMGCKVVAMTSNTNSYAHLNSDLNLYVPVDEEADPNNLAPTASTTAQMALGDAIAVTLLSLRGFTPQHFAKFHPGGSIGKQLYLRVKDLSNNNQKPFVHEKDGIKEIIVEISSKRLGAAAVMNDQNKPIGIITDGDIRRMLSASLKLDNILAKDIMSKDPKTVHSDAMAVDALQIMRTSNINQLLVVDGDSYFGVIHIHDLIKEGFV